MRNPLYSPPPPPPRQEIVWTKEKEDIPAYTQVLLQLAVTESNLACNGSSTALSRYRAIVEELGEILGFQFKEVQEDKTA